MKSTKDEIDNVINFFLQSVFYWGTGNFILTREHNPGASDLLLANHIMPCMKT